MDNEEKLIRILRPIYDAIDSKKYKNAIKLCLNKKIANNLLVLALKAHCLERTGKLIESLELCRVIKAQKPVGETILNTLGLSFRLLGHGNEMLDLYENALTIDPYNEEMFIQLFLGYVKQYNLLKQQQTAQKMYKVFNNKPKYLYWVALSILLQVKINNKSKENNKQLLLLAEKMILKLLKISKTKPNTEYIQLLVDVQKEQDKYLDAIQSLNEFVNIETIKEEVNNEKLSNKLSSLSLNDSTDHVRHMTEMDKLTLEAELYYKAGIYNKSLEIYKNLLIKFSQDDWNFWVGYLTSSIQLRNKNKNKNENISDEITQKDTLLFVASVKEKLLSHKNEGNKMKRGPFLAEIEYYRLLLESNSEDSINALENMTSAIIRYITLFFSKTCCFTDLKKPLTMLCKNKNVKSYLKLIAYINETFSETSQNINKMDEKSCDVAANLENCQKEVKKHISMGKLLRFLGTHEINYTNENNEKTIRELLDLVVHYKKMYKSTLFLNNQSTGGQKEVQYGDDLIILSCLILQDLYEYFTIQNKNKNISVVKQFDQTENSTILDKCPTLYLYEAAAIIEESLEHSKYNYQLILFLINIYFHLSACGPPVYKRYKELDIKQIQYDSLSYIIYDHLLLYCNINAMEEEINNIIHLHSSSNNRDCPEYIAQAYMLSNFSKAKEITEFVAFKMIQSQQLVIVQTDIINLEIVKSINHLNKSIHITNSDKLLDGLYHFLKENLITETSNSKLSLLVDKNTDNTYKLNVSTIQDSQTDKNSDEFSANYDRQVRIDWDFPHRKKKKVHYLPLDLNNNTINEKDENLYEWDKTADTNYCVLWIKIKKIIPYLFLLAFEKNTNHSFHLLKEKYINIVTNELYLICPKKNEKEKLIWQLSIHGLNILEISLIKNENDSESRNIINLFNCTLEIMKKITLSIEDMKEKYSIHRYDHNKDNYLLLLLSSYGSGFLSFFLTHSGHWTLIMISIFIHNIPKNKKKSNKINDSNKKTKYHSRYLSLLDINETICESLYQFYIEYLLMMKKIHFFCNEILNNQKEGLVMIQEFITNVSSNSEEYWKRITLKNVIQSQNATLSNIIQLVDDKIRFCEYLTC